MNKDKVVAESWYDADGFAIRLEDGAGSRRYLYDDDGNLVQTTKYDYGDYEVELSGITVRISVMKKLVKRKRHGHEHESDYRR